MIIYGEEHKLKIVKEEYRLGGDAYSVYEFDKEFNCYMPWCDLSVWLKKLFGNEFYLDINNCSSEIVDYLLENEYLRIIDYRVSGFVTYPLVEILKEIEGLEM